jgi:hypothetical protein
VNAAVKGVTFAFPGSTQAARRGVHFVYFGLITVHLPVTPGRQTGNTRPNDDDLLFIHFVPPVKKVAIPRKPLVFF